MRATAHNLLQSAIHNLKFLTVEQNCCNTTYKHCHAEQRKRQIIITFPTLSALSVHYYTSTSLLCAPC